MDTQSNNLTIPRGSVFFAKFKPGTMTPGPRRQIGNCPEFTLNRDSDNLDHYSSQSGKKTLDARITLSSTLTGNVTTDDIKTENIAYFFMGAVSTITATSLSAQTATYLLVKAGDTYQLGLSDTNPTGHRKVTITTVTDGAGTPVALPANSYEVNTDLGIITFLTDQAKAVVTFNVAASTREQVIAGDTQIEGELWFLSDNPAGPQGDILIPRATIAPNGDFALVNDPESTAFQTLALSISALKKGNLALAYRDGRPVA